MPRARDRIGETEPDEPAPLPEAALTVQRRVSLPRGIMVAKEKTQASMMPRTRSSPWVCEKNNSRLVIDGDTIAAVPRLTSRQIGRYKACATRPRRQ